MLLAVDPGKVRTGLAVSDPSESFALPSATLTTTPALAETIARVALSHGKKLSAIVVGVPLHADGTASAGTAAALALIDRLSEAVDVPVVPFDERRTTLAARASLASAGIKPKKQVDQVAAQALLGSYIAALFGSERTGGATLAQIREESAAADVPSVRRQTARTIAAILREMNCQSLLEIGTGRGYSAAYIAYCLPFANITTVEKDGAAHRQASANLADLHRVRSVNADAFSWKADATYDAVFLDGPKSRMDELLARYWPSLRVGGTIFVDNTKLSAVRDSPYAKTDRQRVRILERMDAFVAGLREPRADRRVTIHDFDDGLAVIERLA